MQRHERGQHNLAALQNPYSTISPDSIYGELQARQYLLPKPWLLREFSLRIGGPSGGLLVHILFGRHQIQYDLQLPIASGTGVLVT